MIATERKQRPIIFSGEMVRAILDGRKTQTRRAVKPQPPSEIKKVRIARYGHYEITDSGSKRHIIKKSPFRVGQNLWVRETWAKVFQTEPPYGEETPYIIEYRSDTGNPYPGEWPEECKDDEHCGRWRPSIHMPRWASRLALEVTGVRVERINEISNANAIAEGCLGGPSVPGYSEQNHADPYEEFAALWDSLNAKRGYSWDSNPWVWVVEFKVFAETTERTPSGPDPE